MAIYVLHVAIQGYALIIILRLSFELHHKHGVHTYSIIKQNTSLAKLLVASTVYQQMYI